MYCSNPSPAVFEFSFQCQSIWVEFTSWLSRALGVGSPRGEEVVERHRPWIHTGPHTDCCLSVCPSAGTWRQETFCWEKTVLFRSQVFGAPYESPSPYQMYWKNSSDSDLKWLSIPFRKKTVLLQGLFHKSTLVFLTDFIAVLYECRPLVFILGCRRVIAPRNLVEDVFHCSVSRVTVDTVCISTEMFRGRVGGRAEAEQPRLWLVPVCLPNHILQT